MYIEVASNTVQKDSIFGKEPVALSSLLLKTISFTYGHLIILPPNDTGTRQAVNAFFTEHDAAYSLTQKRRHLMPREGVVTGGREKGR